jgi:hypothetical protein
MNGVARAQSTTDPTASSTPQTNTTVATNQDDGLFHDWFAMVSATQAEQPHWITPLATTTPRLEQEFRYDVQYQPHHSGEVTDNFGVNKGLEIIPAKNFEVILSLPAYVVSNPDSPNGFADWQFLVKISNCRSKRGAWKLHFDDVLPDEFSHRAVPTGRVRGDSERDPQAPQAV